MSSRHPDAIGYLDELVADVNQAWFSSIRNIAVISNKNVAEPAMLEKVSLSLLGETDSIPEITKATTTIVQQPAAVPDFLELLSTFNNFKWLTDTLSMEFNKQITLVFGTNGSGKSSICESLKVLSNLDKPKRPLNNLREICGLTTSFKYKLSSNSTDEIWSSIDGYGTHSNKIKYFDSTIASHNVTVAVEPGRVISLAPFQLGIFESVRELTSQVREALRKKESDDKTELNRVLSKVKSMFCEYNQSPLKEINIVTCSVLANEIAKAELFDKQKELDALLKKKSSLIQATSEEGLKALRLDEREIKKITSELKIIEECATNLWQLNPTEIAKSRKLKKSEQEILAERLIPKGLTLEKMLPLIKSASSVCELDKATGNTCPLCRRILEEEQIELFKQYYELINNQLEVDIKDLDSKLEKASGYIDKAEAIDTSAWKELTTLDQNIIDNAVTQTQTVLKACNLDVEPSKINEDALALLSKAIIKNEDSIASKAEVINASVDGRDAMLKKLDSIEKQVQPLIYQAALHKNADILRTAQQLYDKTKKFTSVLSQFSTLMTKITNMSKKAYEDLVVSDFETRLNQEYVNLTEEDMSSFGVNLRRAGSDATVTVNPQVGGKNINDVLSEGELRMHSLALFFAELECFDYPILVFDDPISSFDYNYIDNFCIRLCNYALAHKNCQIITLTHNWEFFVNLQNKLNTGGLNNNLSVQVLEGCCSIAEYTEKADELKRDISNILAVPNEPSKAQKEEMAGKLRRLIEAIINTHVFNGERHQYKQKSQRVSVFNKYVNVIPLEQKEANELTDLYSKLSITEHDDPRNTYVNTSKSVFQTRFGKITAIETAILSRK